MRAYILLSSTKDNVKLLTWILREQYGATVIDGLDKPDNIIVLIEAPSLQELSDSTTKILAKVKKLTTHTQLLSVRGQFGPLAS